MVLSVRLPERLHAQLQALAEDEDRSLNRMILHLLKEALEQRRPTEPPPA